MANINLTYWMQNELLTGALYCLKVVVFALMSVFRLQPALRPRIYSRTDGRKNWSTSGRANFISNNINSNKKYREVGVFC